MFKDLLNIKYLDILIITFAVIWIFGGFIQAILISILMTLTTFFYDKKLKGKIEPQLNKILEWIKIKFKIN